MSDPNSSEPILPASSRTLQESKPKTPGMVIAAFILSLLGLLGVTAVIGLILGLIGLRRAKASGSGTGLALAAVIISGLWILLLAIAGLSGNSDSGQSTSNEANTESLATASSGGDATPTSPSNPGPTVSTSPSPSTPEYLELIPGGKITTAKICESYEATITEFSSGADKTLEKAQKFANDPFAADKYINKAEWINDDAEIRYADLMQELAMNALNQVSDGQAGKVPSIDGYLKDSVASCGLEDVYGEAKAKAVKLNALAERITAAAERKPWYPKGYEEIEDGLAVKFIRGAGSDCYDCSYWTVDVVSEYGCPSGLYIEMNIFDANDTVIDWTNDTVASLGPGQKARMQFVTYNDNSDSGQITEVNCR